MIKIENITLGYQRNFLIDFSLTLPEKGLFLLSGESGSGKSTILGLLAGTISKKIIRRGKITLLSRSIAYLPQDNFLLTELTPLDNILLGLKQSNYNQKIIDELITLFNAEEIVTKKVSVLSSGERARIALIRTLSSRKKIILLDEPFAYLNKELSLKLLSYLKTLSQSHLIIFSSHIFFEDDISNITLENKKQLIFEKKSNKRIFVDHKTTNYSKLLWVSLKKFKKHSRFFLFISLFSTLGLIFILLSLIVTTSIKNNFSIAFGGEKLLGTIYSPKSDTLVSEQYNSLKNFLPNSTFVPSFQIENRLSLYDSSEDRVITFENLILPINEFDDKLAGNYLFIGTAGNVGHNSKLLLGIDNNLFPPPFNFQIIFTSLSMNFLAGDNINLLLSQLASLSPIKFNENFLLKSNKLLSIQEKDFFSTNNIGAQYRFSIKDHYYSIYSSLNYFNAQQSIADDIVSLSFRSFFRLTLSGLTLIDENNQIYQLKIRDDEKIGISSDLLTLLKNNQLPLSLTDTDFFGHPTSIKQNFIISEIINEGQKTIYLPLSTLTALASSTYKCKYSLIIFNENQLLTIKELRKDYQVFSIALELENVIFDMGNFFQNTMLLFSLIFLLEGLLLTILIGTYLILKEHRTYRLFQDLQYYKSETTLFLASNFFIASTISFASTLAFLINMVYFKLATIKEEIVSIPIESYTISFPLFSGLKILPWHYLLLLVLSLIIPFLSFSFNFLFYKKALEN